MVQLELDVAKRVAEVMVLFSKKAAFLIQEFEQVGGAFVRLAKALDGAEGPIDVSLADVGVMLGSIKVGSQRTPVEVENYRVIADLLDALKEVAQQDDDEEKKE